MEAKPCRTHRSSRPAPGFGSRPGLWAAGLDTTVRHVWSPGPRSRGCTPGSCGWLRCRRPNRSLRRSNTMPSPLPMSSSMTESSPPSWLGLCLSAVTQSRRRRAGMAAALPGRAACALPMVVIMLLNAWSVARLVPPGGEFRHLSELALSPEIQADLRVTVFANHGRGVYESSEIRLDELINLDRSSSLTIVFDRIAGELGPSLSVASTNGLAG